MSTFTPQRRPANGALAPRVPPGESHPKNSPVFPTSDPPGTMATWGQECHGVIGRIKSVAPLGRTSGFGTLSATDNGRLGLHWLADELMTVKGARRLYANPIISVWHCEPAERAGGAPGKGGRMSTRGPSSGARTSFIHWGAFNKSIQATGVPPACGRNHRRMVEGTSVREGWGATHGGHHCCPSTQAAVH